jgi:hypothetical protein
MILYCLNQRKGTRPLSILETYDNGSFKSISALSQERTSPISFGGERGPSDIGSGQIVHVASPTCYVYRDSDYYVRSGFESIWVPFQRKTSPIFFGG